MTELNDYPTAPMPYFSTSNGGRTTAETAAEPLSRRHRSLTIFALGIVLASSVPISWLIWDLRNVSMIEATEQHIRLADRGAAVLAKEMDIDGLLMETIRISLANPSVADLPEDELHSRLFDTISNFGGIGEILVTDSAGHVIQSLNPHGKSHTTIGQRAYFAAHRADAGIGLQISGPFKNPFSGEPMIVLTRRLHDNAEGFAGIVLASVKVAYLQGLLSQIDAGPDRSLMVMRTDGQILIPAGAEPDAKALALISAIAHSRSGTFIARSAARPAAAARSGSTQSYPGSPARQTGGAQTDAIQADDTQTGGTQTGETQTGATHRGEALYAYRVLDNAPLVLTVGTELSDVLAHWIFTAWLIGLGVLSLDIAVIALARAIQLELLRRHTAERQAKVSERRLRLMIETVEDHAFFLLDQHGRVMVWNNGAQAMLGYAADEIIGMALDVLVVAGRGPATEPNALAVSQAMGRWEAEAECRRKNGSSFPAIIVLSAIVEPDDVPLAHCVTIHNLTNRQRLEQRLRAMERMDAIGQVTSGVAHDFNNLLQAQIMSLELLQERMAPDSIELELSEVAVNAAEQAARLTDQLLAFSRQQVLRPSRINLNDLLTSVVSLAQHTAGPNIRLYPVVASSLPTIIADSAQLQTALLNLIINGRDAINGAGTITLHAYRATPETEPPAGCASQTGFIVVSVTDTGSGMDQETAERACEPFFSTKGAKGSGLGLSMVQGFARQSGGDIRIITRINRGTSVEIWLPCLSLASDGPEERPISAPIQHGHILLVDDAPDVLLVLSVFLRGEGFSVTQATTSREALWHLQRGRKFSVLVSDFLMPGMDGLELAQRARQFSPDMPVLIISGVAGSERLGHLAAGFALLRKPFRKEDLLVSIHRLLPRPGERSLERSAERLAEQPGELPVELSEAGKVSSTGPTDAGAVVEPSSWAALQPLTERPRKPTSM